jgi:hypothetical protein
MTVMPSDGSAPGGTGSGAVSASDAVRASDGVRASDAEREAVVQRLNIATGEGRLTLAEFSDRVDRAYSARTRSDLEPLVADLPLPAGFGAPSVALRPATTPSADLHPTIEQSPALPPVVPWTGAPVYQTTPVGSIKRSGRWRLDHDLQLRTLVGSIKIDLRGAEIAAPVVELHLVALVGSVKVSVPDRVRVELDGHTTVGSREIEQDSNQGDGPLIRLRIDTTVGSVKVYRV